jgi:hypothetical protein
MKTSKQVELEKAVDACIKAWTEGDYTLAEKAQQELIRTRGEQIMRMEQITPEQAVEAVHDMGMDSERIAAFCVALDRQHRTFQQAFMRLVVGVIKHFAKKEMYDYDLRNEASVKMAKQFVKLAEEGKINDGLPLI